MDSLEKSKLTHSINELILILERSKNNSFIAEFEDLVKKTKEVLLNKGTIFFAGNGGSASDADHFATEFVVRYYKNRKSLPAISLASNSGLITACANDYGFNEIFKRQCESLIDKKDLVICLSTSGSSSNIISLLQMCKDEQINHLMISGGKTPKNIRKSFNTFIIESEDTARIQEIQKLILHSLCEQLDILYSEND